jgi:hypothetical protein
MGKIRRRGAFVAEHRFNFGAIRIGEREVCSERDAAVEVIPRAMQIAELPTRVTPLIENVGVVGIQHDQRVQIDDRSRPNRTSSNTPRREADTREKIQDRARSRD